MAPALAKSLIDRELSATNGFSECQIDLAGGEPFLHFGEVREIVDYVIQNSPKWDTKVWFFICTNLTVLDDSIKQWLRDKRDWVILGTSLDGTRESHDHYRCGSYDAAVRNIPFYHELYPQQGVKMTLAPDTLGALYQGIRNIESMGLNGSANVVYEPVWGDSPSKRLHLSTFAEQLGLLVEHYAANPHLEVPNLLSLPIRLLVKERDPDHSWCGSGKTMRAYDIDGRVLPCHRFARFCTRKIYDGPMSVGPRISTKCDDCALATACPTCPGYNWQINGHPDSRTSHHCEFIKLQFLATAKLLFLRNHSVVSELANPGRTGQEGISSGTLRDLEAAWFVVNKLDRDEVMSSC
jgi:sulfatase maturation enzyme AslB (radical SAM superfamily)